MSSEIMPLKRETHLLAIKCELNHFQMLLISPLDESLERTVGHMRCKSIPLTLRDSSSDV